MGAFRFERELFLPRRPEDVFGFFGDPRNLELLTPPWLSFHVLSASDDPLRAGSTIDYRLRLRGFPLHWRSRISRWSPPHAFVDEQVRGPYRTWVHTHSFVEHDGGTLARDEVDYDVPGGRLVERYLVRPDLERIFAYRRERMLELFGPDAD